MNGNTVLGSLSATTEARLIRQVKSSDVNVSSRAFNRLEAAYKPLLDKSKRRINFQPFEESEIEQSLRWCLYRAIKNFDSTKNTHLGSYATKYLDNGVLTLIKARLASVPLSLDAVLEENEESQRPVAVTPMMTTPAEDMLDSVYWRRDVLPAVAAFTLTLTPVQRKVIVRFIDYDETNADVSRSLGMTHQSVSAAYARAIKVARQALSWLADAV